MEAVTRENRRYKKIKTETQVGFLAGLFGCWHQQLSRPFTTERDSYRACLNCGARRAFDPETLKTYGKFYFQPSAAERN